MKEVLVDDRSVQEGGGGAASSVEVGNCPCFRRDEETPADRSGTVSGAR